VKQSDDVHWEMAARQTWPPFVPDAAEVGVQLKGRLAEPSICGAGGIVVAGVAAGTAAPAVPIRFDVWSKKDVVGSDQ
jgi:hypothetical protein